ncbi:MAG: hypothetical protein K2U26_00345 [Cyclobacteriaceae bacterium]|nr:hypothetical protein [Cyclobacteriaceae bacterium]
MTIKLLTIRFKTRILVLSTTVLLAFGCAKIQVYDTSATNSELNNSFWVFESDTVMITYEFWANKGVMSFSVYNKANKPIYIDWKNSSFIHDYNKMNYWVDEEFSTLQSFYGGYYYKGPLLKPGYAVTAGTQTSSSKTVKPERVTFIPPKSYYYRTQFYLVPNNYFPINTKVASIRYADEDKPKKSNSFQEVNYDYRTSPLKFRNYLAFSFSESAQTFFFVDNEFYVSSIKQMKKSLFRGRLTNRDTYNEEYTLPFRRPTSFFFEIAPEYSY